MARPSRIKPAKLIQAQTEIDEIPLDEATALALQLAQSRINEAQLALQLRQGEMERITAALRSRFEEGGKFVIKGVDFQKLVVTRVEAKAPAGDGQAS